MTNINFNKLLDILTEADAIQYNDSMVGLLVFADNFELLLEDDDLLTITENDIKNLIINDCGDIEFELFGDICIISVLERKNLLDNN